MRAWRIDSLDVKAGYAFASQREPWSKDSLLAADGTVFFQPPDFVAQRVATPSVGYAASRAMFQLGLYQDPATEVAFPALDAVRDFVRRVYLRASGDGAPPGGEGPLTPLPESPRGGEDIDLERFEGTEGDVVAALRHFARDFVARSQKLEGVAEPHERSGLLSSSRSPSAKSNASRLVRAALRILWTLKERIPPNRKDESAWLRWTLSAGTLACGFDRLQLWPLLLRDHAGYVDNIAAAVFGPILRDKDAPILKSNWATAAQLRLILLRHVMLTGWPRDAAVLERPHLISVLRWFGEAREEKWANRPFESLVWLPIPRSIADGATAGRADDANLQRLLLAAIAAPGVIASGQRVADARAELVFFAASWLASFPQPRRQPIYPLEIDLPDGLTDGIALAEAASARTAGLASDWLARNLPSWIFAPRYEEMIDHAIRTRELASAP